MLGITRCCARTVRWEIRSDHPRATQVCLFKDQEAANITQRNVFYKAGSLGWWCFTGSHTPQIDLLEKWKFMPSEEKACTFMNSGQHFPLSREPQSGGTVIDHSKWWEFSSEEPCWCHNPAGKGADSCGEACVASVALWLVSAYTRPVPIANLPRWARTSTSGHADGGGDGTNIWHLKVHMMSR